jgi:uncharacterized protein GlcG (DUF336 family)
MNTLEWMDDSSYHYDLAASKKAYAAAREMKPHITATGRMRELIEQLKPSNVTDVQREMRIVLDRIVKEMTTR